MKSDDILAIGLSSTLALLGFATVFAGISIHRKDQLRCDAVIYVPPFEGRGLDLMPTMFPQRFLNERVMRCDGDADEIAYLFNYTFRVEEHQDLELYHFRHPDMMREGADLEKPKKLSGVFVFMGRWVHQ